MTETQSDALLPVRNKLKSSYLVDKDLSLSEDGVLHNSNRPKMPSFGLNQDYSLIGENILPIKINIKPIFVLISCLFENEIEIKVVEVNRTSLKRMKCQISPHKMSNLVIVIYIPDIKIIAMKQSIGIKFFECNRINLRRVE